MTPWKKKKLMKRFAADFGKAPEKDYDPGDLEHIRSFYDALQKNEPDRFHVDETTWKDLDLDSVYKRFNACQCAAGEQTLYAMLRTPMDESAFREQQGLIHWIVAHPDLRLKLQLCLSSISNRRNINLTSIFQPKDPSPHWLILYLLLGVLFVASFLAVAFLGVQFIWCPMIMLMTNTLVHTIRRGHCEYEIDRVNYCVSLVLALHRLKKGNLPRLEQYLSSAYEHLHPLKPIIRSGPVMSAINGDSLQTALIVSLMIDLVAFEILKKQLAKYHEHFLAVHTGIGRIDASIAIASCRAQLPVVCEPQIAFDADRAYLHIKGMEHPLLTAPVPNDLQLERSMLITGSNASGKSTCLKSAMLCALLAQTLCLCTCKYYAASPFRLYTSLALSDNLLNGESYYIAEIRSLKRILDAARSEGYLFCAIDEVLRGTNTVERIAASAEILKALNQPGVLCLIATHDAELCALCDGEYQLAHFEETIQDQEIQFDYKLKPRSANTRNAILLLKLMGFEDGIVSAAFERAERFEKTGNWTLDPSP
ncbi:MAG: hypothetical protein IJ174_05225 [Clostridia bacterium]|nr:hypothetical protein [Clostridia bacterium]